MKRTRILDAARARLDATRAEIRRRRAGTHLLEEMGGHPEQLRRLTDPVEEEAYWDIAEQLLDGGLAEIAEQTGWIR